MVNFSLPYIARLLALLLPMICFVAASLHADIDTSTRIFNPRFRTLKTMVEDNFMARPVIRLGTQDRLIISFDEIGEEFSYLECRLIHCNRDWQPSRLVESEYVDGFNSMRIEDYAYSFSTYVHYSNYQIVIPNEDLPILVSGNYLLQVYDPDEPDEIILQTRFQVSENAVSTDGMVTSRTDRGHNTTWQQIAFNVDTHSLGNINPYQDITVEVQRNLSDDTRRTVPTPLRTEGPMLVYDHLDPLVFPASNEYRRFESTSNSFPGMHVDSLRYMGSNYHVWLKEDRPRVASQYSYDRTQHGRFLVREYNSSDSDLGADYISVHFLLNMPELTDADVYVDGEFCHGVYDESNRMTYDREKGAYTAMIPLKQGAYNYQYVVKANGSDKVSPTPVEGDKYETDNEYGIEVWFSPPGARADRLVGYKSLFMN